MTDELDRQIVAILGRDGRADAVSIAEHLDAVPTTVQKRLRALEEDDVVEGYTVRLDYESLGYLTVLLRIDAAYEDVDAVTSRLRETTGIVTVYETSDRFNVFAVGKFGSERELGEFLEGLHSDTDVRNVQVEKVRDVRTEGDPVGGP